MSDSFSVLRYEKSDRDEVFALLRVALSITASEPLISQWDWKYDGNPFNLDNRPYILLLRDGPQLIGLIGALPVRAAIGGIEHWVSHSCDWVLRTDYRNRGVGRRVVEQMRGDRPLRFSWQNALSHRSLRRDSGRYVRIFPLVRPLDFSRDVAQVTRSQALARYGAVLASGALRLASSAWRPAGVPGVRITQLEGFDERFDDLWERVRAGYRVILARDRQYLQWRFKHRPDVSYVVLGATAAAQQLVGYVILRDGEVAGERVGYIVDFLVAPGSAGIFSLLVNAAAEWFARGRANAIICRATVPAYRRTLYACGFVPFFWGDPGYVHAVADTRDPTVQSFQDPRQWYLTMGDGDLEMAF